MAIETADTVTLVGGAISAVGALGLAAYALVDASKAFWGGISNVGFLHIERGCQPFADVMANGVGQRKGEPPHDGRATWQDILRAQWRNGRDKETQKAHVRTLVRLGLTEGDADKIADFCNVNAGQLQQLITRLKEGRPPESTGQPIDDSLDGRALTPQESNLLGRIDAVIGYQIDAAFERAEQMYRNWARITAGAVAMILGAAGAILLNLDKTEAWHTDLWYGLAAGILAVPIAPIAKDLTSSLSTAVTAVKKLRGG